MRQHIVKRLLALFLSTLKQISPPNSNSTRDKKKKEQKFEIWLLAEEEVKFVKKKPKPETDHLVFYQLPFIILTKSHFIANLRRKKRKKPIDNQEPAFRRKGASVLLNLNYNKMVSVFFLDDFNA